MRIHVNRLKIKGNALRSRVVGQGMSTGEVQVVGGGCIPDLTKCVWHMLMGAFECVFDTLNGL